MKLTPHFSLEEFVHSATAQANGIDNSLNPSVKADQAVIRNLKTLSENILEPLRDHACQPIVISSGYRCPALNQCTIDVVLGKATDYVACGVVDSKWKKISNYQKEWQKKYSRN